MTRLLVVAFVLAVALPPAAAHASNCDGTQTGLVPLTAPGFGTYQGYPGGLYPGGSNTRPPAHEASGIAIASAIAPLDTFGTASANGRIVFISIGMSNCTQEFSTFVQEAANDAYRDPRVQVIDCAAGGQTASIIKNPAAPYWSVVQARLTARGSSKAQVQVVWLKEANAGPTTGFPGATTTLMQDLGSVVRTIKDQMPNARIVYLSSRTYGGYASTPLNPEPYAYESGFAVRWLIEAQIAGEDSLEFDPGQGAVEAPWLSWGPYLWADGVNPNPAGLSWQCADFVSSDGTHPSTSGRLKVANMLLAFVHQDATAQLWYVADAAGVPDPASGGERLVLAPNPAHGGVELSIASAAGERWRLEVLDLGGRRVCEIASGVGDGATRALRWDARDGRGAPVRAGIYWVRLTSGAAEIVRRLALLGER
jgi:hypothetical protein